MRINSKEELQSKKAEIEQNIQSFTCRVLVCSGTGCMASGAQKIYDEMVRLCEGIDGVEIEMQKDIPHVGVIKTGCQGLCELGPLVRIEPYGRDTRYIGWFFVLLDGEQVTVNNCKDACCSSPVVPTLYLMTGI